MKNRIFGILLVISLSVLMLMLFLGEILKTPGNYYFDINEQGLTNYYSAVYHARFDRQAIRSEAMNYPFGESIAFSGSQPLLVNSIRFISNHIVDISNHTVALINMAILLSFILGALFIYLIFDELSTRWWFASPASVAIAMLSPNVAIIAGNITLSWIFWIPLTIFLIIRFDRTRKVPYTLLIGLLTYCSALIHLSFTAIIGFLLLGYWFFRFIWYRQAKTFWYRDAIHIFFQFVFPVLIFQFTTLVNEEVTDRTSWPRGLYENLSDPVVMFLSEKAHLGFVTRYLPDFSRFSYESHSFIGTTALIGLLFGLVWMIRRVIKKENILNVTHLSSLNVLFWVSASGLLFSFGLPMIVGMKFLSDYLEPLRQLRVLSRFSWPFFYLLNIVILAALAHRAFHPDAKWLWKAVAGFTLIMLSAEGICNLKDTSNLIKNRIPALEDRDNKTEVNQWVHHIQPKNYQAIVPIPYFHVGSENIWIVPEHGIKEFTMIASLKTGLPTTGVELSRTSISQTYHSYALFTEPLERLEFPDFLPDERPLLLLQMKNYQPGEHELRLIRHSEPIVEASDFIIYELPVSVLRKLNLIYKDEVTEKAKRSGNIEGSYWQATNSEAFFAYESYDNVAAESTFNGVGALDYQPREWTTVWHDTLNNVPGGTTLLVSFWVKNFRNDGFMRTNIEFYNKNPENSETTFYLYSDFFRFIKAYSGDWALVEFPVVTKTDNEIAKFSVRNDVLPKADFSIDELMIREYGLDVFKREGRWLWYNNRKMVVR